MHHLGRKEPASAQLQALRALPLDDAARAVIFYISAWDAFSAERSEEVVACVAAMLDCLERIPDVRLWLQCANLSLLVGLPGMGPLLDRFAAGVARVAGQAPSQLRAAMLHVRAGQAIGAGRLDEAWDWLQRADEDCRWLGRPRLLMTDNGLMHVLLHALRGEAEACFRHGQQVHQDMMENGAPSHRRVHLSDMLAARARAAWVLGDEAAQRRVDRCCTRRRIPGNGRRRRVAATGAAPSSRCTTAASTTHAACSSRWPTTSSATATTPAPRRGSCWPTSTCSRAT